MVRIVARDVRNFVTNFGVSLPLPSRLMGQHKYQMHHVTLRPSLTFYLDVTYMYVTFCALGVSHVMRYINLRYLLNLLTYLES